MGSQAQGRKVMKYFQKVGLYQLNSRLEVGLHLA